MDPAKLKEIFQTADKNNDGSVSAAELKSLVNNVYGQTISTENLATMFQGLDSDGDMKITLDEFLREMTKADRRESYDKAFKKADVNGDKKLSRDEIVTLLKEIGTSPDEVEAMLAKGKFKEPGFISYEEFMDFV